MMRKHYYYFELAKGKGYLLYDGESLIELDSPLSIGDENKVKNAVTKLPKDKNGKLPIVTYSTLRSTDIRSDTILFDFKRDATIDFEERNKKKN